MVRLPHTQQLNMSAQRRPRLAPVFIVAVLTGCVHVAPYERGAIARPDMAASDIDGPAERHAISIHEGASRGGVVAESGCGCN
jgi:Domain of unknown function (DUF4266)